MSIPILLLYNGNVVQCYVLYRALLLLQINMHVCMLLAYSSYKGTDLDLLRGEGISNNLSKRDY